jgi:HEAT repeat associated with sister chromatid cohesion
MAESVRVSAIKTAALYCTHGTPVLSLLIARCCDPSAKVRATAVNLVSA